MLQNCGTLGCLLLLAVSVFSAGEAQAQVARPLFLAPPRPARDLKYSQMPAPVITFDRFGTAPFIDAGNKVRLDDTPSREAKNIVQAHTLAREQAYDAVAYLSANRSSILAGNDPIYNEVFGRYYDRSNEFYQNGEYQIDTSHYARVLNTFTQVKTLLDNPTDYSAGAPFDRGALQSIKLGGAGASEDQLGLGRGYRQWGYTNSRSEKHYVETTSRPGLLSLLWVDDNQVDPGRGKDFPKDPQLDYLFFRDKMTIYGDYDEMNRQYVGIPFLEELWDGRSLQSGAYRDRDDNPYSFKVRTSYQLADGTEIPLLQHNMILASFSEFTEDPFDLRGGMFHGLQELFVNQFGETPAFLQGADAYNFSTFVDRLEAYLSSQGKTLDIKNYPPSGKNVRFSPAVPRP